MHTYPDRSEACCSPFRTVQKTIHRFFIPPDWLKSTPITLGGETARQIHTVLRMSVGDEIILLDNSGLEFVVRVIAINKHTVQTELLRQQVNQAEPTRHVTLCQGMLKGQKFEWVLQKGTEIGVSCFVPLICQRSVVNRREAIRKKYNRWRTIIREAAEQSGRGRLPTLTEPERLDGATIQRFGDSATQLFLAWEEATTSYLRDYALSDGAVTLLIGPEGGFTAGEVEQARSAGAKIVHLGPRILRAETAAVIGSAWVC